MPKTLLYRLFKIGRIPAPLAEQLQREFILFEEEGIPGSATYHNFRSPGRYFKWSRQWFTASVALTETRLLALRFSRPMIDVPLADGRIRQLRISAEGADTLLVGLDAALFHPGWSGTIEYRFRTPQASFYLQRIQERIG